MVVVKAIRSYHHYCCHIPPIPRCGNWGQKELELEGADTKKRKKKRNTHLFEFHYNQQSSTFSFSKLSVTGTDKRRKTRIKRRKWWIKKRREELTFFVISPLFNCCVLICWNQPLSWQSLSPMDHPTRSKYGNSGSDHGNGGEGGHDFNCHLCCP